MGVWALAALVARLAARVAVGVSRGKRALLGLVAGLTAVEAPAAGVATRVACPRGRHRLPFLPGGTRGPTLPLRLGPGAPTRLVAVPAARLLPTLGGGVRFAALDRRSRATLAAVAGRRLPTSPPARRRDGDGRWSRRAERRAQRGWLDIFFSDEPPGVSDESLTRDLTRSNKNKKVKETERE